LPKRIKEWICPDELSGKFFWQDTTAWKIANKIFLTALSIISASSFAIKYGLTNMSAMAPLIIGGLDFSELGISIALLAAATCAYIDGALSLYGEYKNDAAEKEAWVKVEQKREKWAMLCCTMKGDRTSLNEVKASLFKRARKIDISLSEVKTEMSDLVEFAELKMNRLQMRHQNAAIRCNRLWISMISNFTKTMAGFCSIAVLVYSVPVLTTTIGIFSLFTGVLGLFSLYYDSNYKILPVPVISKKVLLGENSK
jgi:hypothetical protein